MQATADGPTARIDPVCVRVRERGATKQNSRTQSSISLVFPFDSSLKERLSSESLECCFACLYE